VISGIILAGGRSSRLGRPKQLLELDGKPLLQHVIDAVAAASLDEVVIVLGHQSDEIASVLDLPPQARAIVNFDYNEGQSTSLLAGLASLDDRSDAAVVILGDQPSLDPAAIRKVVETFQSSGSPIVRAMWDGRPGHPVVFARSIWDELSRLAGDLGARDFLAARDDVTEVDMGSPAPVDVDTWESYERLKNTSQ
jgi:molybdenum cofactor cytidylyltransferase